MSPAAVIKPKPKSLTSSRARARKPVAIPEVVAVSVPKPRIPMIRVLRPLKRGGRWSVSILADHRGLTFDAPELADAIVFVREHVRQVAGLHTMLKEVGLVGELAVALKDAQQARVSLATELATVRLQLDRALSVGEQLKQLIPHQKHLESDRDAAMTKRDTLKAEREALAIEVRKLRREADPTTVREQTAHAIAAAIDTRDRTIRALTSDLASLRTETAELREWKRRAKETHADALVRMRAEGYAAGRKAH